MKLPKIRFEKYGWTSDCYRPSFKKYFSGKMWSFSVFKYGVVVDFRESFKLTDLLTDKEKKVFFIRLWFLKNRN